MLCHCGRLCHFDWRINLQLALCCQHTGFGGQKVDFKNNWLIELPSLSLLPSSPTPSPSWKWSSPIQTRLGLDYQCFILSTVTSATTERTLSTYTRHSTKLSAQSTNKACVNEWQSQQHKPSFSSCGFLSLTELEFCAFSRLRDTIMPLNDATFLSTVLL